MSDYLARIVARSAPAGQPIGMTPTASYADPEPAPESPLPPVVAAGPPPGLPTERPAARPADAAPPAAVAPEALVVPSDGDGPPPGLVRELLVEAHPERPMEPPPPPAVAESPAGAPVAEAPPAPRPDAVPPALDRMDRELLAAAGLAPPPPALEPPPAPTPDGREAEPGEPIEQPAAAAPTQIVVEEARPAPPPPLPTPEPPPVAAPERLAAGVPPPAELEPTPAPVGRVPEPAGPDVYIGRLTVEVREPAPPPSTAPAPRRATPRARARIGAETVTGTAGWV